MEQTAREHIIPPPLPPSDDSEFDSTLKTDQSVQRGLYKRWFGKMNEGSLRLVVINLTLCGTTGSFFWYPYFLRVYGFYAGIAIMMLCVYLSYVNCRFILEASKAHDENDYLTLIRHILGRFAFNIGKVTYFLDYFSTYVIGLLIAWNVTQYLLYYAGVFDDSMRSSQTALEFKHYHPKVLLFRSIFMWGSVLAMVPLFKRENMNGLKYVFMSYTFSFLCVVGYLMFDLDEFKTHYQKTHEYQITLVRRVSPASFRFVLIFLCAFYVQPNLLTMKRDLANPTEKRLFKSINIAHIIFMLFGLIFGIYGYLCLGDLFTTPLFMLRQSYPGKEHEWIYRVFLGWTTCNAIIYLSFFNLSFKNYINSLFDEKPNQNVVSFGPLLLATTLAWSYPKIEQVLGFNAIFVCLINGFIFPTLLKRQTDIKKGSGFFKRYFWSVQVAIYIAFAVVSFYQIVFGEEFE